MGLPRARERELRARVPRPARARQAHAQGTRVGTHRAGDAAHGRARHPRRRADRPRPARVRRDDRRDPRQAARAHRAQRRRVVTGRAAAWTFVGPALAVIAIFFAVPVVAALALSFTDFDLYALADLRNLRFIGLGNYVDVL